MKTYSRIEKLQAAVMLVQSELKKPLVVADIGTDHGYLADLLSKNEQVEKIIATDISAKSLSKLEAKINYKKLSKIETAVGDGLIPVKSADVSVIAGVGCYAWQRVVVAYPHKYGCCHYTVVVVALDSSHLLAVFLELIEV